MGVLVGVLVWILVTVRVGVRVRVAVAAASSEAEASPIETIVKSRSSPNSRTRKMDRERFNDLDLCIMFTV